MFLPQLGYGILSDSQFGLFPVQSCQCVASALDRDCGIVQLLRQRPQAAVYFRQLRSGIGLASSKAGPGDCIRAPSVRVTLSCHSERLPRAAASRNSYKSRPRMDDSTSLRSEGVLRVNSSETALQTGTPNSRTCRSPFPPGFLMRPLVSFSVFAGDRARSVAIVQHKQVQLRAPLPGAAPSADRPVGLRFRLEIKLNPALSFHRRRSASCGSGSRFGPAPRDTTSSRRAGPILPCPFAPHRQATCTPCKSRGGTSSR